MEVCRFSPVMLISFEYEFGTERKARDFYARNILSHLKDIKYKSLLPQLYEASKSNLKVVGIDTFYEFLFKKTTMELIKLKNYI